MKLKIAALFSVVALAATAATPALAGSLDWNFYTLTGMPPSPGSTTWPGQSSASWTATFNQGGVSLLVDSATSSGCSSPYSTWCPNLNADLYAKNGGTGEQGLGLTNDPYPYNEIGNPYGIYVAPSEGYISSVQLGSVQSGETWSIWGSNGPGYSWTLLGSGQSGGTVNFSSPTLAGYNQLIVADPYLYNQTGGNSNDIILASVTTVPEPGTLALFAAGLLGCGLFLRRRGAARQS